MSKPIILTEGQWAKIYNSIAVDPNYPRSTLLIRNKMRSVLGFTSRTHMDYNQEDWQRRISIHLDFYDEAKRTMFLLKYSEHLNVRA